jgi:hypothetical protein
MTVIRQSEIHTYTTVPPGHMSHYCLRRPAANLEAVAKRKIAALTGIELRPRSECG